MNPVSFRSDDEICLALYKSLFPDDNYKHKLFNWQFASPQSKTAEIQSLLYKDDDQFTATAFNGLIPIKTWQYGKESLGYWSCDFIVNEQYRGQGVGSTVKKDLKSATDSHTVMSLGISDSAIHVLRKMGWKDDKSNAVEHFHKIRHVQVKTFKEIAKYSSQLFSKYFLSANSKTSEVSAFTQEVQLTLPEKSLVDQLWQQSKDSYDKVVVRDFDYLDWKYQRHPMANNLYRYLICKENERISAIFVFRISTRFISVVDYVGEKSALSLKYSALSYLLSEFPHHNFSLSTNDVELKKVLLSLGFYKLRGKQRFVAFNSKHPDAEKDWFLMGGDSDGELLLSARAAEAEQPIHHLACVDEFKNLKRQWTELLKGSHANKLFMSWEWQYSWWTVWAQKLNLKLMLICSYQFGQLVAITPLYLDNQSSFKRIRGKRLQFIGNRTKTTPTVRTEYISAILRSEMSDNTLTSISHFVLSDLSWNEFVLSDVDLENNAQLKTFFDHLASKLSLHVWETADGYYVNTTGSFDDYKSSLGRNTRASYFNKLKKLDGNLYEHNYSKVDELSFFSDLNNLHKDRWNKVAFNEDAVAFHLNFLSLAAINKDVQPMLMALENDGKTISYSYNVAVNETVYNLQSGFIENYASGVAVGKLHIGLLLSNAFARDEIRYFDFLAGKGKHSNFKSHLSENKVKFSTVSIYSDKFKVFYKLMDLKNKLKVFLK